MSRERSEPAASDGCGQRIVSLAAIPEGELLFARTVGGYAEPLADALDRAVTGCLVVRPAPSLLVGADTRGVLTLVDGVPRAAYETSDDLAGGDAVAGLASDGPARVALYAHEADRLAAIHETATECLIAPDAPAQELADDSELARATRDRAPTESDDRRSAAAAFLADEQRVAALRAQARAEARERAAEWGLEEHLQTGE